MSFEHDVMISYAWRDNQPPPLTKQEGWVSGLHEGLEFWLKQVMPRPPKIWRDKNRMPGNKVFAEELDEVVRKCAVLLAVLSEPYLASEWCERERKNFIETALQQGGLEVENDYRIFKINKMPVDRKAIPQELNIITGFDFYEMDAETRMPVPIDPSFGEQEAARFSRKVYNVSVALSRLLKQMETKGIKPGAPSSDTAKPAADPTTSDPPKLAPETTEKPSLVVFLPHTTRDLREVRDELVAELMRRNCQVLPEEQGHFEDIEAFRAAAEADIARADIAIHLIGARHGMILEGATRSVIDLQNEWAAAECAKRNLRRLIWLPKDLGEVTGAQAAFIDCLRTDRNALAGADLLEDSLENLKSIVIEMLKPKPAAVPATPAGQGEFQLFILHDPSDRDGLREVRKALRDMVVDGRSMQVTLPVFDGDAATIRDLQRQRLLECDAVLLYWGNSSQAWLESCLNEVRKAPGFGRSKGFAGRHLVMLSGAKTSAKEDWWLDFKDGLLEEDIATIEGYGASPIDLLHGHFQTMRSDG